MQTIHYLSAKTNIPKAGLKNPNCGFKMISVNIQLLVATTYKVVYKPFMLKNRSHNAKQAYSVWSYKILTSKGYATVSLIYFKAYTASLVYLKTYSAALTYAAAILAMIFYFSAERAPIKHIKKDIVISFGDGGEIKAGSDVLAPSFPSLESPSDSRAEPLTWKDQVIKHGDNLSIIFQRSSLSAKDVLDLTSIPLSKPLLAMQPGQKILFGLSPEGELIQLRYIKSKLESYLYTKTDKIEGVKFVGKHIILSPEVISTYRDAIIEDSLFLSGERARLPYGVIMELANIFGWDIDFALDIRKGDSFAVLYEEKFVNGEKIAEGHILAAEFVNQGRSFTAVRYLSDDGKAKYYTPEGYDMRKTFLRAPLDFTRISSSFNLKRQHPIHKKIIAHRGVDYAAPRGTPILAAGDGKIIASSYNKANGNYIFIQHGQEIITKYLHLQKRKVKKGQKVSQRQIIGTLGSTGYSTGPHLHYEFLINGVHKNPRTVALPQANPIKNSERARFGQLTKPLVAQLKSHQQTSQLAMILSSKK
ncbi:MAG: murein DD-endopeptidase MepM/ murein hydrolase activator NlpD [Porticoccus sp.]|jgi:murein DD-endopeptidase MepM/ murein hydrolase activator NlpD